MITSSFLPRAIAVFLIIQVPIWGLADLLAPSVSGFAYESSADKVAQVLGAEKDKAQKHLVEVSQTYNLAWVHLTDKTGKTVLLTTRPKNLPEFDNEPSRVIDGKGSRFIELSRKIAKGEHLGIGFRCPQLFESVFGNGAWPAQLPTGTVVLALFLNALAFIAAYLAFLGLPLKKLLAKLGPGEDLNETYPVYVSAELPAIAHGVKQRFASLKDEHDKTLSAARTDLSGQFVKEVEDRFINKLANELVTMKKRDAVYELINQRLIDEFTGVIKLAFGFEFLPEDGEWRVVHHWNCSDEHLAVIQGIANSQFATLARKLNNPVLLSRDELASKRLDQLVSEMGCEQVLLIPFDLKTKEKAYVCFLLTNRDQQTNQKVERIAMRIAEQIPPLWQLVVKYEESYRLSRHDALTTLNNRVSLEERFERQRYYSNDSKTEIVHLVFEGDNFRVMLNSYGPRTIDMLIKELSEQISRALEQAVRFKKASMRIDFSKHMYRVGGCRFLLILEDLGLKKAIELAEQVSQSVADHRDWAHGLPSWSVSCGISSFEAASGNHEDCFEEASISLEYVRSRKSTALVLESKEVPEEFMSRAQSRNRGDTSNLEPAALLHQICQAKKTGILTVSEGGRTFWSYIEEGVPAKARLGKLCGDSAVVEFISSFVRFTYRLQDLSTLDTQTGNDMRSLGGAYLIQMKVQELIDFSVVMRDQGADARVHLKTPDMIVHPTTDKQANQIEQVFFKIGKTPNKLYLDVVNKVWDICTGRFNLEEIVNRLDTENPQALIWAAADFLMQNKLIKFSRLRVTAHTDGSTDRDMAAAAATRNAAAVATAPAPANTGFVSLPRVCISCRKQDPLSQKFCVHCGAEMVQATSD